MKKSANVLKKPLFKNKNQAKIVPDTERKQDSVTEPRQKRSRTDKQISLNSEFKPSDHGQGKSIEPKSALSIGKTEDSKGSNINIRRRKINKRTRHAIKTDQCCNNTTINDVVNSSLTHCDKINSKNSNNERSNDSKITQDEGFNNAENMKINVNDKIGDDMISDIFDNRSFVDFFDGDDSKLADLNITDLISSQNNSEHQDAENTNLLNSESKDNLQKQMLDYNTNSESLFSQKSFSDTSESQLSYHTKIKGCFEDILSALIDDDHNQLTTSSNDDRNNCGMTDVNDDEEFYGLPLQVQKLIKKHKGIDKLYDWQNDCLSLPGVKERKNLIYSLPTSGGKTLVAEILIMKELLCNGKDAMLILPFVSIVQEKVRDLSLFAVDLEFLVEEYASSKGKYPPRKRKKKKSLYVATIEKANGLVNSLIEEKRLSEIGLVVVDELHMLGEGGHRGATLEMCLSKLLFCSSTSQIIGMSATLNNIEELQSFLCAEKYINDFRPVELKEFLKVDDEIYEVKKDKIGRNEEVPFKRCRRLKHQTDDKKLLSSDPDHLSVLVQEVIPKYSCLVFCATKKNCQNVAELLAQTLPRDLKKVKVQEKHELLKALKSNADGLCPVLRRVIPYGIAYHHSGLTMDERKLIEEAYSQGTLCLLTCTSTLAAGVNLPAKRVILRSPHVGMSVMSRSQYKQMIGRAGRAGIDTSGESILIFNKKDKQKVIDLVNAPLESCRSSLLHNEGLGLRSLVLSLIGLKVCNSLEELQRFISKTLLAVQSDSQGHGILFERILENIEALSNLKLVKKWETTVNNKTITNVETTALGRATFKGCLDVDRSPFIYDEIKRAQENLVLANDLHLLYLVTTPDMIENIQPSWLTYLKQFSSLNNTEQKAAEFIGVSESLLSRKISGYRSKMTEKDTTIVKRFYLTLMLYKLIQEQSLWDVANTFEIPRGFAQSLFTSSCSFASCLVHFTMELPEFYNIKLLLETIVDKLSYTAVLELVPLMQIPGVKKARAKQLYTAGYQNLQKIAKSDVDSLVQNIEHLSKIQANVLISSAKMMLVEKAEALQDEAAELIKTP